MLVTIQTYHMKTKTLLSSFLILCSTQLPLCLAGNAAHPTAKASTMYCKLPETVVDKMYDRSTVVHVEGIVEAITELATSRGPRDTKRHPVELHFVMSSKGRTYGVHVGP